MGKKQKGRCVRNNKNALSEPEELIQAPHSFVIHRGVPGDNIMELTKDFRKVMEPYTAAHLKERKKNAIKDFVAVAGPLHVSHLSIFSRTDLGMYLKLCRLPRGPSLTFKIHKFSLSRDVISSLKKQLVVEEAFKHSPLIVLNSFSGEGMHMKLMASTFQNMFPTINLTNVDLNTIRRCVLLNYNATTKQIDFRHYAIKIIPVGISKGVKKVVQGKVPNLARCSDISEFLTKAGMLSESEADLDDGTSHVTLTQKIITRGNIESGKSSIKLSELGPRLTLQLIKIEDGLLDGEVLYHDLVHKTDEEKIEIEKKREAKKKLKEKRKKVQEQNKRAKEQVKQNLKDKSLKGMAKGKSETDVSMKKAGAEAREDTVAAVDDDVQYYREEVGEEPDKELFSSTIQPRGKKRPFDSNNSFKNKRMKFNNDRTNAGVKKNNWSNKNNSNKERTFGKGKDKKRNSGKGFDKTNSQNRDFSRPIGGAFRNNKREFNKKQKNRK